MLESNQRNTSWGNAHTLVGPGQARSCRPQELGVARTGNAHTLAGRGRARPCQREELGGAHDPKDGQRKNEPPRPADVGVDPECAAPAGV